MRLVQIDIVVYQNPVNNHHCNSLGCSSLQFMAILDTPAPVDAPHFEDRFLAVRATDFQCTEDTRHDIGGVCKPRSLVQKFHLVGCS